MRPPGRSLVVLLAPALGEEFPPTTLKSGRATGWHAWQHASGRFCPSEWGVSASAQICALGGPTVDLWLILWS